MADLITLGDRTYEFRKLKLGELRAVQAALRADAEDSIGYAAGIIAAALPDHNLTPEALDGLEALRYEIDDAATKLLKLTGFQRSGEVEPQPAA
jgi:hypothetical protein